MPQSILIIDDSEDIHMLVKARLSQEDVEIRHAYDAREGLAAAAARPPDLVLLDLDLNGGCGSDVCRSLKRDTSQCGTCGIDVCRTLKVAKSTQAVPVIFITATADTPTKVAAFDAGAVDYVTKPFDGVELRARVRAALRTKLFQDLLTTRAQLDGLTGLSNRAFFDARLAEELAMVVRHDHGLALALVDVDHFKRLNDTYGHPFGDEVLRRLSSALVASVRTADLVCRYGGEEFAVLFRETDVAAATLAAERLRAGVERLELAHKGQQIPLTASVGVVSSHAFAPGDLTAAALLQAADEALYVAKHGGRNRVVNAGMRKA